MPKRFDEYTHSRAFLFARFKKWKELTSLSYINARLVRGYKKYGFVPPGWYIIYDDDDYRPFFIFLGKNIQIAALEMKRVYNKAYHERRSE